MRVTLLQVRLSTRLDPNSSHHEISIPHGLYEPEANTQLKLTCMHACVQKKQFLPSQPFAHTV